MAKKTNPVKKSLVFNPPSKQSPGYARRMHRAASFKEQFDGVTFSARLVEAIIDFLADYCTIEGEGLGAVKEALWDASQEQFEAMLDGVIGGSDETKPPLAS